MKLMSSFSSRGSLPPCGADKAPFAAPAQATGMLAGWLVVNILWGSIHMSSSHFYEDVYTGTPSIKQPGPWAWTGASRPNPTLLSPPQSPIPLAARGPVPIPHIKYAPLPPLDHIWQLQYGAERRGRWAGGRYDKSPTQRTVRYMYSVICCWLPILNKHVTIWPRMYSNNNNNSSF